MGSDSKSEGKRVDLAPIYELAGGDSFFVMALLGKMVKNLPESFGLMRTHLANKDYKELKAATHKAKGTFAYLGLEDIRAKYKEVEVDAMEGQNLDQLPDKVDNIIALGNEILDELKEELAKIS